MKACYSYYIGRLFFLGLSTKNNFLNSGKEKNKQPLGLPSDQLFKEWRTICCSKVARRSPETNPEIYGTENYSARGYGNTVYSDKHEKQHVIYTYVRAYLDA